MVHHFHLIIHLTRLNGHFSYLSDHFVLIMSKQQVTDYLSFNIDITPSLQFAMEKFLPK